MSQIVTTSPNPVTVVANQAIADLTLANSDNSPVQGIQVTNLCNVPIAFYRGTSAGGSTAYFQLVAPGQSAVFNSGVNAVTMHALRTPTANGTIDLQWGTVALAAPTIAAQSVLQKTFWSAKGGATFTTGLANEIQGGPALWQVLNNGGPLSTLTTILPGQNFFIETLIVSGFDLQDVLWGAFVAAGGVTSLTTIIVRGDKPVNRLWVPIEGSTPPNAVTIGLALEVFENFIAPLNVYVTASGYLQ